MRKVKKGRNVTASRPAKRARKGNATRTASGKPAAERNGGRKPAVARKANGKPTAKPTASRKPEAKGPPERSVRIRELDPLAKCGSGTSVQFLYRVDELLDGAPTAHLVFFDRHGWYCEHGRNCPAVADVRRLGRQQGLFTD